MRSGILFSFVGGAAIGLALFGAGCTWGSSLSSTPSSTTHVGQVSSTLSDQVLQNLQYPAGTFAGDINDTVFRLHNGNRLLPTPSQPTNHGFAQLGSVIGRGDLNGDGYEDAIVSLSVNLGGSGTWPLVYLVMNDHGTPKPVLSNLPKLDDRDIVNAITIIGSHMTFDLTVHGPNDPSCCPSVHKTESFIYQNGMLSPGA
jgi:hypothetical protein